MRLVFKPRDNPFRSSRIEALRYRNPDAPEPADPIGDLLERWQGMGRRGALVGPKGHGKTTLLEQMERRLEAGGHEIRRLRPRVESPTPDAATRRRLTENLHDGVVIGIDGLELLRPFTWWRLRRPWFRPRGGAIGVLATSHRPGRLPTLHEHRTTPELLRSLVRELLGDVPVDDGELRRLEAGLDELFARHDGNVRECLRELYDRFSGSNPGGANSGVVADPGGADRNR